LNTSNFNYDKKRIIVPLDVSSKDDAFALLDQLDSELCRVKVGKQLFTSCGPTLVADIIKRGYDVFLDLKFHDIPNTVAQAVEAAADLGVWMVNVHASGGRAMLEAASKRVASRSGPRPLLIGVTVLTSLSKDDLLEVGLDESPEVLVKRLALLSADCGLDGVVCSAGETPLLRQVLPEGFHLVTPGIRRPSDARNDQKRVTGPAEAIQSGSSYLVVGRPITEAESPREALREFNNAVAGVI